MATPTLHEEFQKTFSREKWAIKIKAGPDVSDIIGLNPDLAGGVAATAAAGAGFSNLVANSLLDVGTIEKIGIKQIRSLKERYALGPNPHQPFQIVPQNVTTTISLSRVVLKRFPEVERTFNFLPQNLIFQQLPFLIELTDRGDDGDGDLSTAIQHFFTGCWFVDSNVEYSMADKGDQRVIQNVNIKVTRMLTFDQSLAGNPVAQGVSNIFGGVITNLIEGPVIEDLILL